MQALFSDALNSLLFQKLSLFASIKLPTKTFAMSRKVFIKTFGCQMNEYDSSKMLAVLKVSYGITPVDTPAEADILLINTCSIREKA